MWRRRAPRAMMLVAVLAVGSFVHAFAAGVAAQPEAPPPFPALRAGAAWRLDGVTDLEFGREVGNTRIDAESDPTQTHAEMRVVEERANYQGGRLVRWEWWSDDERGPYRNEVGTAIIDSSGMRLIDVGHLPASPRAAVLPASFAKLRSPRRIPVNRTVVVPRHGWGCFEHQYRGPDEGDVGSWRLCFDESGVPRWQSSEGTGDETSHWNPVPLAPVSSDVTSTVIAEATASSSATRHPPAHAFDGQATTAWSENAPGSGAGEWIEARFTRLVRVAYATVTAGWDHVQRDGTDLFPMNRRMASFDVEYDGGRRSFQIPVREQFRGQGTRVFRAVLGVTTSRLRIIARVVAAGPARTEDLCISEIRVFEQAEQ